LDGAERGSGLARGTGAGRSSGLGARSGAGSARTQRARAPPRVYAQAEEPYDSEDEEERGAPAKRRRNRMYVVTILVLIYCSGAGTLLSIFVPQTCGTNSCRYKDTMCLDFEGCSVLQRATLIINFVTFAVTVWALLWFWTREKWLNTHLMRDVHLHSRYLPKSLATCVHAECFSLCLRRVSDGIAPAGIRCCAGAWIASTGARISRHRC
jgi:hypothetical protein